MTLNAAESSPAHIEANPYVFELPSGKVAVARPYETADFEQLGDLYEYSLSEAERESRFFVKDITAEDARTRGLVTVASGTEAFHTFDLVLELFDADTQTSEIIGHSGVANGELHFTVPAAQSAEDKADRRGLGTKLMSATLLKAGERGIPMAAQILNENVRAHRALKTAALAVSASIQETPSWSAKQTNYKVGAPLVQTTAYELAA